MNFKLKTLVAAVVLAASATSANAVIEGGNTVGNSEFVFSAWDINTGVGYTLDLNWSQKFDSVFGADAAAGTNAAGIAGNAAILNNARVNSSLIGAGGVIYDDVLTGIPFGANIADVQWSLNSLDNAGRTRLVTTKDSADAALFTAVTNNGQKQATTTLNAYYAANNSFSDPLVDDTFAITADTNGNAYAGTAGSASVNNSLFDTTNALGGTSFLYFLAQSTLASSAGPSLTKQVAAFGGAYDGLNIVVSTYQQAGQWRLNIAAVPEPETYAMFLAGLGIMGAVARRRKGQVK